MCNICISEEGVCVMQHSDRYIYFQTRQTHFLIRTKKFHVGAKEEFTLSTKLTIDKDPFFSHF